MFDHVYFAVPRPEPRQNWQKTIDQIAALKPAIVIPGHEGPGATRDMRSIDWMKKYMADWDANVTRSKDAASMRANVLKQCPVPRHGVHLGRRVAGVSPLSRRRDDRPHRALPNTVVGCARDSAPLPRGRRRRRGMAPSGSPGGAACHRKEC